MKIDTIEVFTFPVHNTAGRLADADALPVASAFEDDDDAEMDNPTVEQIGALTGWYRVIVDADSALYTVGKTYNIHVDLTVGGVDMGARVAQFFLEDNNIDDIGTLIGIPVALDGGAATLGGMLTKLADDNDGADFDATRDSQNAIAVDLASVKAQTDVFTFDASDNVNANVAAMEDGIIVASKIGLGAITADKIAADAITADKIADDAIEPGMFSDNVPADIIEISGDATAADNLELQFDGTGITDPTFPARQDQLDDLVITGSAINTVADSFTLTTGSEVGGTTYANTFALDGVYHQLADTAGTLDAYYEYLIGSDGVPTGATLYASLTGLNDALRVFGYNWITSAWVQVGAIAGQPGVTIIERQFPLLTSMVGTGANAGTVRLRLYGTGLTTSNTYIDFGYVSYSVVNRSVGYSDGAVWVDEAGNSGTTPYINGTADNPCPWADALVIAAALGLHRFRAVPAESITLSAGFEESAIVGKNWDLALGGQAVSDSFFDGGRVSGTGTSTGSAVIMEYCGLGTISLPACRLYQCGIGRSSGAFSASQAGQFNLIDCFSLVPGSGTPTLNFAGTGGTTGINIRRWSGGSNITLDANCTLSLEVVTGGGQTIVTGGGNAEVRGICRSLTVTSSGASVTQFSGIVGPVTINGTAGTVRLYGVVNTVTDASGGLVTIENYAVEADIAAVSALIGTPVALDGGAATLGGMLTKIADDNAGADFNAATDSLHEIAISGGGATAQEVWEYVPTGGEPASSTAELLVDISDNTDRVDGLIEDDGLGADRFTAKALEEAGGGGSTAQEIWEYELTGNEPEASPGALIPDIIEEIEGLNNLSESDMIRIITALQRRLNPNGGIDV